MGQLGSHCLCPVTYVLFTRKDELSFRKIKIGTYTTIVHFQDKTFFGGVFSLLMNWFVTVVGGQGGKEQGEGNFSTGTKQQ